jgi:PAS domain S-box-containing protein
MWDIVTPIVVGGRHLGNLFLGQFLFLDEEPDLDLFREQARKYGFDESSYVDALQKVPRWSMEQVQDFMSFYTKLTTIISSLGHKNLQLLKTISHRDTILDDLRESRAMFSGILNSVPQSIFWKDKSGIYLGCNESFALTAGLKAPGEIIGKTDFDLPWPHHEAEAYRKDDAEVIGSNRIKAHIVEQLQQFDGSRLWIDTTKVPLTDSAGNAIGVLGVYEDITSQKQMELSLLESEKKFSKAFQFSPIILAISTMDEGRYIEVNEEFLRSTGYTRDEVIGSTSIGLNILKAADRKTLVEELRKVGQYAGLELDLNTKEGRTLTCIVNAQIIEFEGKPHLLSTILDITPRKQMEQELKNEMMRLEMLNSHMVNRELRMIELKKENAELRERLMQKSKS